MNRKNDREEWRPVVGYEGYYMVSNLGRVRSLTIWTKLVRNGVEYERKRRGRVLKQQNCSNGYKQVHLAKDGLHKIHRVHRIVAEAFVDNPVNLPEVNHKDGDKQNNCASNLEWCTHSYNTHYRDYRKHGERNGMSKLKANQVKEIKRRRESGEKLKTIADDFGISVHHVSNIARGVRWGHESALNNR